MTSSFYKSFFVAVVLLFTSLFVMTGQTLRVKQSASDRIYRELSDGHSLVLFESSLENLSIESSIKDKTWRDVRNGRQLIFIEANVSQDTLFHLPNKRKYCLKADDTDEFYLTIENMQPKNVYYYVVTLQKKVPLVFTAEYNSAIDRSNGVRMSLGRRFGAYLNYQWGQYRPSGNNIDNIMSDGDLSNAKCLGYIKTLFVAGLRTCINTKALPVFLYIGGGYGEYGRQWDNHILLENTPYFYSDYIRGGALEVGATILVPYYFVDWLKPIVSLGTDMILNRSRVSIDYQVGFGLSVDFTEITKRRK